MEKPARVDIIEEISLVDIIEEFFLSVDIIEEIWLMMKNFSLMTMKMDWNLYRGNKILYKSLIHVIYCRVPRITPKGVCFMYNPSQETNDPW
ncbi:MAG: hypothetical protein GY696_34935 [Gammaproteobacteria bacterium]|nr:hypothetical protein [Gammaproteobacteria bacterium]